MDNMLLNGNDGNPSTTRTVFLLGSIVCLFKLMFSGCDFHFVKMSDFTGADFALAITALGSMYGLNKHVANIAPNKEDK